jgi:hypothetical protein
MFGFRRDRFLKQISRRQHIEAAQLDQTLRVQSGRFGICRYRRAHLVRAGGRNAADLQDLPNAITASGNQVSQVCLAAILRDGYDGFSRLGVLHLQIYANLSTRGFTNR